MINKPKSMTHLKGPAKFMSTQPPTPVNGVTGFVLAGGKSTRLGRDKALLEWQQRTMLEHMVNLLSSVTTNVQIVGRDLLPDVFPGRGPLSGILTALQISRTDINLAVAVDLPLLTKDFLQYLRFCIENSRSLLVACKIESYFPLCLGLRRTLVNQLEQRVVGGELSVQAFIESACPRLILEPELRHAGFDCSIFRNINTEEDYRAALETLNR